MPQVTVGGTTTRHVVLGDTGQAERASHEGVIQSIEFLYGLCFSSCLQDPS